MAYRKYTYIEVDGGINLLITRPDLCRPFAEACAALDLSAWSVDGICRQPENIYAQALTYH